MAESQTLRVRADHILELHEAGELDAALAECDELIDLASPLVDQDDVARESLFAARLERALVLTERGDLAAAAEAYAEAAETPYDPGNPDERHEVAMALLNRGICLAGVGHLDDALTAYDDLLVRFSQAEDPVTADQVTRARVNRAVVLLELDRAEDALQAARQLVATLDAHDVLDAEQRLMAVRVQAAAYQQMGRPEDALAALVAVDDSLTVDAASVRLQAIAAQTERVGLLDQQGRGAEAAQIAARTLTAVGEPDDPDILTALEDLRTRAAEGPSV